MTNTGALRQTPQEPPASTVPRQVRNIEENDEQLLELRTDAGAIYVRPSRWQRIRLQWTFRHFHVLSPQVLSRSDQRLIEKLSQSAVVTPSLPRPSGTVFGVVEKARSKSPASANRVVTLRRELAAPQTFLAKSGIPGSPSPDLSVGVLRRVTKEAPGGPKTPASHKRRDSGDIPFQQWGALGALAAVGFVVILASNYGVPLFSNTGQMRNPQTPSTPIEHAANAINPPALHPPATRPLPVSSTTAPLPNAEKPKRWVATPPPEPTLVVPREPAPLPDGSGQFISASRSPIPALATASDTISGSVPIVPSATPERRFVLELPQGHFAHPVFSQPNLVGELQLKALIGADGSVKDVTVLSGSPQLAEVGMRAVRQWHYSPNQVLGSPVEMETHIKMNFFGQDAVSIASVAKAPTSPPK